MPQPTPKSTPGKRLHVAHSALSDRIYAGSVAKDGCTWLSNQTDVTSEVLEAIIKKIGAGNVVTVNVDGVPAYEIAVREIAKAEARWHGLNVG